MLGAGGGTSKWDVFHMLVGGGHVWEVYWTCWWKCGTCWWGVGEHVGAVHGLCTCICIKYVYPWFERVGSHW